MTPSEARNLIRTVSSVAMALTSLWPHRSRGRLRWALGGALVGAAAAAMMDPERRRKIAALARSLRRRIDVTPAASETPAAAAAPAPAAANGEEAPPNGARSPVAQPEQ